jgi:hypothetical protein
MPGEVAARATSLEECGVYTARGALVKSEARGDGVDEDLLGEGIIE